MAMFNAFLIPTLAEMDHAFAGYSLHLIALGAPSSHSTLRGHVYGLGHEDLSSLHLTPNFLQLQFKFQLLHLQLQAHV